MAKLRMEDNCLEPYSQITLKLKAPNPAGLYKKIKARISEVLGIAGWRVMERKIYWDVSSDPNGFWIFLYATKPVDAHSKIHYEFIFKGSQPSDASKSGNLEISITARLITEFDLSTAWQRTGLYKGFLWIYLYTFYRHKRREYIRSGKDDVEKLKQFLKNELGFEES